MKKGRKEDGMCRDLQVSECVSAGEAWCRTKDCRRGVKWYKQGPQHGFGTRAKEFGFPPVDNGEP